MLIVMVKDKGQCVAVLSLHKGVRIHPVAGLIASGSTSMPIIDHGNFRV
jgi:hypothetical protein